MMQDMANRDGKKSPPVIFFREEDDHTGFLFNVDNSASVELNRMGVFIWKQLAGGVAPDAVWMQVAESCGGAENLPPGAVEEITAFARKLAAEFL